MTRAAGIWVALSVVISAFVLRQPGTSAGSHFLGALVTLAVFALLARTPAWELLLGLYATVVGALALAEHAVPRDLVGISLLVVGPYLIVLGTRRLWRLRSATRIAAALVVGFVVVLPVLLAVAFVHTPREAERTPSLGHAAQRVSFETRDGLHLHGWYVPSRNGASIVAFPELDPEEHARMLVRHGYGVLLFDPRGRGTSDGDPNPFAWGSTKDLDAALAWLRRQPDVNNGRIGGLGLSCGGEQLLEEAASSRTLRAVVSEGAGYRSFREYRQLGDGAMTPMMAVLFGTLRVLSPEHTPPPLDRLVPRIAPRPVLLIEAGHGQGGEELNARFAPATLWRIPDAHHTGGLEARPHEYEHRVVGFFDRALR